MKLLLVIIALLSVACAATQTAHFPISLSDKVPPTAILKSGDGTRCYHSYTYSGVSYDIATDCDGDILLIKTNDPAFVSPEGLRIGNTLQDALNRGGNYLQSCRVQLPSGWRAGAYEEILRFTFQKSTFEDLPCSDYSFIKIEEFSLDDK